MAIVIDAFGRHRLVRDRPIACALDGALKRRNTPVDAHSFAKRRALPLNQAAAEQQAAVQSQRQPPPPNVAPFFWTEA